MSEVWHDLAGLSAQGFAGLTIRGLPRYILIWAQVLIQARWLWAEFNSFSHLPCGFLQLEAMSSPSHTSYIFDFLFCHISLTSFILKWLMGTYLCLSFQQEI